MSGTTRTMHQLSQEFGVGALDIFEKGGLLSLTKELSGRMSRLKDEILLAWFAEHGFAPGKAEIVEDHSDGTIRFYIREQTRPFKSGPYHLQYKYDIGTVISIRAIGDYPGTVVAVTLEGKELIYSIEYWWEGHLNTVRLSENELQERKQR